MSLLGAVPDAQPAGASGLDLDPGVRGEDVQEEDRVPGGQAAVDLPVHHVERPAVMGIAPPGAAGILHDLRVGVVGAEEEQLLVPLAQAQALRAAVHVPHDPPQTAAAVVARLPAEQLVHHREAAPLAPHQVAPPVEAVISGGLALHDPKALLVALHGEARQGRDDDAVAGRVQDAEAVPQDGDAVVEPRRRPDVVAVGEPGPVAPGQPQDGVRVLVAVAEGAHALQQDVLVAGREAGTEAELVEVASAGLGPVPLGCRSLHPAQGGPGQVQGRDAEQLLRQPGLDPFEGEALRSGLDAGAPALQPVGEVGALALTEPVEQPQVARVPRAPEGG